MDDLDNTIGFWLENIPYVWHEGKTIKTCKRYYIFECSDCLVFTRDLIAVSVSQLDAEETYSILPLAPSKKYDIVRNCFLYQHSEYPEGNIRVEGRDVSGEIPKISTPKTITITNPGTDYSLDVKLYKNHKTVWNTSDLRRGELPGDLVDFGDDPNVKFRKDMEDEAVVAQIQKDVWLYAVLDGHGGDQASSYFSSVIPEALSRALSPEEKIEDTVVRVLLEEDEKHAYHKDRDDSGCTFTGMITTPDMIYLVNLGDSRTTLKQGSEITITTDHKPKSWKERQRIFASGGAVNEGRVNGILAVSRALGDYYLKGSGAAHRNKFEKHVKYLGKDAPVSPIADIISIPRKGGEFVIIACDGLYDVISSKDAMKLYEENDDNHPAKVLVQTAIQKRSTDNITVICVRL